jgi:uncharacterized protein YjbI with pentapeptide repeats
MRNVIEGLEITHSEQHQLIQDEQLSSLEVTSQALAGSTVQTSTYTTVAFSSCVFFGCEFKHVKFLDCKFVNCIFEFSHIYDCHFENCTFENCTWGASTVHESQFIDCELDTWLAALTETHNNVLEFTFSASEWPSEMPELPADAFIAA